MGALTVSDLTVVDGGARISDAKLMEALGFGRIDELRRLIQRHREELEAYGAILQIEGVSRQSDGKIGRGRPTLTYMLTEEQALLVCMFARTEKAAAARRMIIEVSRPGGAANCLPGRAPTMRSPSARTSISPCCGRRTRRCGCRRRSHASPARHRCRWATRSGRRSLPLCARASASTRSPAACGAAMPASACCARASASSREGRREDSPPPHPQQETGRMMAVFNLNPERSL
jgi:phage anti-repressor protein